MKNKKFPTWLTIEQKDRAPFLALTIIYSIYVLPILLANRPYQDDLSRSLLGVTGWNNDARPLTEWIITWLCGGSPINDVHPLPLLLSVLLLAYTITLYTKRYLPADTRVFPALCIGFLVIANPFLLSNLSYRFDCVTMVLALCATILPYVVPERKALWKIFMLSLFMCLVTLTTYQPACGIYISLWFLEVFFMILSERIDLPRLFMQGIACIVSVVLYKYFVLNSYIRPGNGGWQPDAYSFAWRSEDGLFSGIAQNLQSFTHYIDIALQGIPMLPLLLFVLLTAAGMILTGLHLLKQKRPLYQRICALAYLLLLPVFVILGTVGPLLILRPSSFSISAHTLLCLCSVGIWAGVMISAIYLSPTHGLTRLVSLLFLPCMVSGLIFSYSYGNAMTSQKLYEEYLTYSIAHDVETLNADGSFQTLTVSGRAPRSPQTARLCEKYPLFGNLVPTYLTNSSYMGGALLLHYTQESFRYEALTEEDQNLIGNTEPSLANSVYACYENGNKIIILFP